MDPSLLLSLAEVGMFWSEQYFGKLIEDLQAQTPTQVRTEAKRFLRRIRAGVSIKQLERNFQKVDCPFCYLEANPIPVLDVEEAVALGHVLSNLWNHTPREEFNGLTPFEKFLEGQKSPETSRTSGANFEDYGSRLSLTSSVLPHFDL